ncbi:MAG: alanine--tRNA ligase [Candidatus Doudnabacteria bacterium]|nr:alanine--tRNA ligase [Candidatus Doudnabacteria bacterium]
MNSQEIRQKYLQFFETKNHQIIPSASLVPANDPTVLFTTAGMHPLVPYLIGEQHPKGTRLVNYQKCLRTDDIDEVGDDTHNTFFEMLGNWSLGDYWKGDSINWSYEFLISPEWLGIDKSRLAVSVFMGDSDAPEDNESVEIWKKLGVPESRIARLGKKDNWWGPAGATGPCGPDTEIFYWIGQEQAPETFDPGNKMWVEVWNNVFMQYEKTTDGKFIPLKQKNVDTGMGLERITTVLARKTNVYETDLFEPIMEKVKEIVPHADLKAQRIIADHLRAATFMIADGIVPSNKDRGYILRRLIRRSVTYIKKSGVDSNVVRNISESVVNKFSQNYPELKNPEIYIELDKEETKFRQTLAKGLKLLEKLETVTGKEAFDLFQTYGFPFELTMELSNVNDPHSFKEEFSKHQELSRTASAGQFKGGLASNSDKVVRLHTATHLLNTALRKVLGSEVWQKGSNITEERTRFDFTHDSKMTDDQKLQVEKLVNEWIERDLSVKKENMTQDEARKLGAIGVFGEKYPDQVSVYTVFDPKTNEVISREFCGGPHVEHTGVIGKFKIQKEESVSAGVRRIKAIIE